MWPKVFFQINDGSATFDGAQILSPDATAPVTALKLPRLGAAWSESGI
jgi:hypothetical protein